MSNNKNVWLVSTDRPSRLSLLKSGKLNFGAEIISFSNSIPQHLYITSDEEIKQGDWCIYKTGEIIQYLVKLNTDNLKKITITTDQDLIYDGVQTIDDKFLEWFAKNPSCVRVEVEKEMYVPQINGKISDGKITHELSLDPSQNTLPYYKIIIKEMSNTQTAVEWFFNKLENHEIQAKHYELFTKAKAMEKEQIKNAYVGNNDDEFELLINITDMAEQYYNETYGKDNE
jgi:intergrase/recombinase